MLQTIYHFNLNDTITQSYVTLGKCIKYLKIDDGKNHSLAFASVGGKVIIYSPHEKMQENNDILKRDLNVLNLNKEITGITFGQGDLKSGKDYLFLGSPTNLMCYDIQNNKTLFNKDIFDGVYCITNGLYGETTSPLTFVGGNCSLQGFDINGEEKFWTVTGGNTLCITLIDLDEDNLNELLVGTDDFSIRFYKNENIIFEISENTKIIELQPVTDTRFLYGLENGTIGVYSKNERIWRKKEKGVLTSSIAYDINGDGVKELFCGWSTGKLQVRNEETGDVMHEKDFEKPISKLLVGDLNNLNKDQIICCNSSGDCKELYKIVYGYVFQEEEKIFEKKNIVKDSKIDKSEIELMDNLLNQKKQLQEEIEELTIKISNRNKQNQSNEENIIPSNTTVKIDLQSNHEERCADLTIETSNTNTVIKCVIVVSEQLYKGETYVEYPVDDTNKITVQIKNERDMNINLHLKVLVGRSFYSKDFQVFEYNKVIPKYCFYILVRGDNVQIKELPRQGITMTINERYERLLLFLEKSFNIPVKELALFKTNDCYDLKFLSLRTDKVLQLFLQNNTLKILSDEIELVGNLFQDLCADFTITDVKSNVDYPLLIEDLTVVTKSIERLDNLRNHFTLNMAEIITYIKDLFVRTEDNRYLQDWKAFKDYFGKINLKTLEILDEFEKRSVNYDSLLSELRKINNYILYFANLKIGSSKNKMINVCREAIRNKNYKLFLKVLYEVS